MAPFFFFLQTNMYRPWGKTIRMCITSLVVDKVLKYPDPKCNSSLFTIFLKSYVYMEYSCFFFFCRVVRLHACKLKSKLLHAMATCISSVHQSTKILVLINRVDPFRSLNGFDSSLYLQLCQKYVKWCHISKIQAFTLQAYTFSCKKYLFCH